MMSRRILGIGYWAAPVRATVPAALRLGVGIFFAVVLASGAEAKSHKQPPPAWQSSVAVAPDAPEAIATKANPVCAQLTANTQSHVTRLQSLIIDMAKSRTAPPSTALGVFKNALGHTYIDKAARDKAEKLEGERRTVNELNGMLVSLHCQAVDVEHYSPAARTSPKVNVPDMNAIKQKLKAHSPS